MPRLLRSVCCGVLCPMITTLGIRGYLYGIGDVNVLRMGLYLILPLALAVSLDVLFKLIRMYQFGLQMKLKKEEYVVCSLEIRIGREHKTESASDVVDSLEKRLFKEGACCCTEKNKWNHEDV